MSAWAVCIGYQQLSKSRRLRGETPVDRADLLIYDARGPDLSQKSQSKNQPEFESKNLRIKNHSSWAKK
jgi:hypothetical protein